MADQCALGCVIAGKQEPIAIGALERFVADYELAQDVEQDESGAAPRTVAGNGTGRKVAVVGSGPAGLSAAGNLARLGHKVTLFEALHYAGGVLMYGIPEFRLPKSVVAAEIDRIRRMDVDIEVNTVIGRTITIDQLMDEMGYEAVFIGSGAGSPRFMGIPGENLKGVYSANEFLTRVNLMKANRFPEYDTPVKKGQRIAVIGAGDTAPVMRYMLIAQWFVMLPLAYGLQHAGWVPSGPLLAWTIAPVLGLILTRRRWHSGRWKTVRV